MFSFLFSTLDVPNIQAHNFDTDDNSTFLTLINQILIENRLVNSSISDTTTNINNTFLSDYIKNIKDIIDDIIISEDSFVVDSDQFYNNTIIATVIANLADDILRKYGSAFGIPSNVMLSMNFERAIDLVNNNTKDSRTLDNSSTNSFDDPKKASNNLLVNEADYYNAKEISNRMIEIYDSELDSSASDNSNSSIPLSNIKNALYELNREIDDLASPTKIMEIVHAKVHPNLQLGFNLSLKR